MRFSSSRSIDGADQTKIGHAPITEAARAERDLGLNHLRLGRVDGDAGGAEF